VSDAHDGDRSGLEARPIGRRGFLAAGAIGLAGAAVPSARAAGGVPPSPGPGLPIVQTSGDTSGATDANAIANMLSARGWVQLLEGTYWVNRTIALADWQQLVGVGRGVTVIKLASGANCDVIANANTTTGTTGPAVRYLTIDGNRSHQSSGNNRHAINFTRTALAEIESVEAHDCATPAGVAAVDLNGAGATSFSRRNRVDGLWTHDNSGEGFKLTFGCREAALWDIRAWSNGDHGVQLDASECEARGIYAWQNAGDGISITNVFGATYSDFQANRNGKHGIEVYGLVLGTCSNWIAHDNSQSTPNGYDDLHFADDGQNTYGVSDGVTLTGVSVGPHGLYTAPGNERYGLYAADGVTGNVVVLSPKFAAPGMTGTIRRPVAASNSRFRIHFSGIDAFPKAPPVTVNGAGETTLVQQKVAGGMLGPLGDLRCSIVGDHLNATGATHKLTLRVYAGPHGGPATKIYDGTTVPLQAAPTRHKVSLTLLFANRNSETANALTISGGIGNAAAPAVGIGLVGSTAAGIALVSQLFGSDEISVDTSVDWDLQVTVQLDAADPSLDLRMDKAAIELIP
jgi:hypothetical protein